MSQPSEIQHWVAEAIQAQQTPEKKYVSGQKIAKYLIDYAEKVRPLSAGKLVAASLAMMQQAKLVSVKKNSYALTAKGRKTLPSGKVKRRPKVVRTPIWVKA
jgi:hypothetical protein